MDFATTARRAGRMALKNSPALLTAIGVSGVVSTAYLTGKATFKAAEIIREAEAKEDAWEEDHPFGTKEKFNLVWKEYIPAAALGLVSIACIISANHINAKRVTALASAYSIVEKAASEYKEKVVEVVGKKKEEDIRAKVAQDRIDNEFRPAKTILVDASYGNVRCMDMWSGREFNSSVETLKKAQNDTQYEINNSGYASLTDFYDRIGLPKTQESDEVGWHSDGPKLDLVFDHGFGENMVPVLTFTFRSRPETRFWRAY